MAHLVHVQADHSDVLIRDPGDQILRHVLDLLVLGLGLAGVAQHRVVGRVRVRVGLLAVNLNYTAGEFKITFG